MLNTKSKKFKVSVIIPTKDRLDDLMKCIDSIIRQTMLPDEVIIVDSSEKEVSPTYFKEIIKNTNKNFTVKILYFHTKKGGAYQRNFGAEKSSGDILIFIEDDEELYNDFIEKIVEVFKMYHDVSCVSGKVIEHIFHGLVISIYKIVASLFLLPHHKDGKFLPSGFPTWVKSNSKITETEFLFAGCLACKRKVFLKIKFDEKLGNRRIDDDFSYRVSRNHKCLYTPFAKVTHHRTSINRDEYSIMKAKVQNSFYLFKKNIPQTFINRICFAWAIFGTFIIEAARCIITKKPGKLLNTFMGIKDAVKKGIKSDKKREIKINISASIPIIPGGSSNVYEKLIPLLEKEKRGKLLDAGTGKGVLSTILKNMNFEVQACDINPEYFKIPDIRITKMDLNKKLEYESNYFDYVVAVEVIEHLENPWNFIKEGYRILKPNGKLILTTPNVQILQSRLYFLLCGKLAWFRDYDYENWGHISPIFEWNLKRMIKGKFEIEDCKYNLVVIKLPLLRPLRFKCPPLENKLFGEINIIKLRKI